MMYYYEKIMYQYQLKKLFQTQFMTFLIFAVIWHQQNMIVVCSMTIAMILTIILQKNSLSLQQKEIQIITLFQNLKEVIKDLPRHHFLTYCNQNSLSPEMFEKAYQTLENGYVYIILSDTRSPASELISLFTKKQYNHASIAFDKELKTMVSYNNGQNRFPPGLHAEKISHFYHRQGACIMVYTLEATAEQKRNMILKIEQLNREGNSYNTVGLLLKHSFQPNIMFCSQFVYHLLHIAGIAYFEKKEECVKPMDFVELDYKRKLKFLYEKKL